MRKIIVVGLGDYYKKILQPSLERLRGEGRVELAATVDVVQSSQLSGVEHLVRSGEPLSVLLKKFLNDDPVVILAHANHMHVSDTIDLCTNGFKVALEKPYALNVDSLYSLFSSVPSQNYFLIEYYLMMKAIPLLLGYGQIKRESFYCDESIVDSMQYLTESNTGPDTFSGSLPEIIGDIESINVDLLEGEGETGTLSHRGVSLVDIRAGGGMIQDLGIHALAPLYAIGGLFGSLELKPDHKSLRIAKCFEYVTMAKDKFGLTDAYIGETYAEFSLSSKTHVKVQIRLGKYILGDRNQRGITIVGKRGTAYLDLNNPTLFINGVPALGLKKDQYKYYPVLRAMIDYFDDLPLFVFPVNKASAKAQEAVINVQSEAYRVGVPQYYQHGTNPEDIFA